jgi:hypothetical protein
MKHWLLPFSAFAAILISAGSVIHPFGTPKQQDLSAPLLEGATVDPATLHILERACLNCHSERTVWPWYGSVAPTSWMLERDVSTARQHMNLSRWNGYTTDERREMLGQIGVMVRGHLMPPPPYRAMHPEARLSEEEIAILYKWERAERARLAAASR